jgi:hypothetical protein
MHLARSTRRHILTLRARLPTSNLHIRPSPIRAAPITAQNINRNSIALNGASNLLHGQIGNRNASGGSAGRTAVLVVLLNDNALVGDARELDVVEGYARNFACGAGDGLNAHAVGRVGNGRVGDVTLLTVLSSRPPTEPIERPWPPEQVPPVKTMFWMRY